MTSRWESGRGNRQGEPPSLAWDLFFALSVLFAAPVFRHGRREKCARALMIVSGVFSLAGLIGVPFAGMRLLSIGILGYGVAAPVAFLLLAMVFGRTLPLPGTPSRAVIPS